MGHTFLADPTIGCIIYENSDDLPIADPFTYRTRVIFYSGWRYPARVDTRTGSVTFAAGSSGAVPDQVVNRSHTLFAHGRSAAPLLMEGKWIGIGTSGADVPMIGSVPVQNQSSFRARWATLGADATNVYIHEQHNNNSFGGGALAALTISWEVHLIEFLDPVAGQIIEWTPTLFRCGDFSSEERYVRTVSSGGYALVSGITTLAMLSAPSGVGSERVTWHYAVPGFIDRAATTNVNGGTSDPGTPTPTVRRVTV